MVALAPRYDSITITALYHIRVTPHRLSLLLALLGYHLAFSLFRLYRYAWRFASLDVLVGVIGANTLGVVWLAVLQRLLDKQPYSPAVLIEIWLLGMTLVGGLRFAMRLSNLVHSYGRRALQIFQRDGSRPRVVILGGGAGTVRVLAALKDEAPETYDIIGVLSEAPNELGIFIRGVRVLGTYPHLYELLANEEVDEVFIALPDASGIHIRDYVLACRRQQVKVKVLPDLNAALHGTSIRPSQLEEISVEDLLRRPPVRTTLAEVDSSLTGKRVLITGAGGSIGSELCRQVLDFLPDTLVLLGHGENSLHLIHRELMTLAPVMRDRLHIAVGSVSDDVRMNQIFQTFHPQVVFHAAAHKHVPIMERNLPEAVQNNVLGTRCVADCCGRFRVERMVAISTDKAVYPSSVMGATKWLCEEIVRAVAQLYPSTAYVTVRFGNVLGSRGSVVPLFKEQIRLGGPVTITHTGVTRYFMTIPEAVQLVLQAGAIGLTGKLYLLEMGEPVKILDLAHDMIRLSGYEPDKDIMVHVTGLRPGEKLHEALTTAEEVLEPAPCPGLSVVQRPTYFTPAQIQSIVKRLQQLASIGEPDNLLTLLDDVVPAFAHQRMIAETMTDAESIVPQALPANM